MSSKSCPTFNSAQRRPSIKQLGRYTDPVIDKDGRKTAFKRKSEESLERASKKSRTSQSPTVGCKHSSGPSTSFISASCAPVHPGPVDCHTGSGETSSLPKHSSGAALVSGSKKTSSKRKSTDDESQENRKRSRRTPSPSEDPKPQTSLKASSSEKPGTSSSVKTHPPQSKAAFEAKYKQEEQQLGKGSYGTVFAGHRIHDNLPVAIKRTKGVAIGRTYMLLDGKTQVVPMEVALLLKLEPVAAVVNLLDWYSEDSELILVLERPVPCMDLVDYMESKEWSLQEQEVKTIAKQLLDALIEVHSRGVFHRDIKLENILIETGSDVPRVRLIDFGCGTLMSEAIKSERKGAIAYAPPEWFQRRCYMAEPTDVWQLGLVLFVMLNVELPFRKKSEIISLEPVLRRGLSTDCNNFVQSCLTKRLEARPTLETLRNHPWLM